MATELLVSRSKVEASLKLKLNEGNEKLNRKKDTQMNQLAVSSVLKQLDHYIPSGLTG